MKNSSKIFFAAIALTGFFSGCSKVDNLRKSDPLPVYQLGVSPVLSSSASTVAPALADSSKTVVTFSWSNPKYSNDSATTKYILEIDTTGKNFAKENTKTVTGALNTPLTGRELNGILLNLGFKLGVAQTIDVRLISSYGNNNERYMSNVVKVTVTPFADPSVLTTEKNSVVCSIATSTQLSNTFRWTSSFKGYSGNITYTLQYDSATKNFASVKEVAVGTNVLLKALTEGEINTTAIASGIAGGSTGSVDYRIKATAANGQVSISNAVTVSIKSYVVALYLVGGSSPAGWTPSAATPMIPDPRFPGTFFTYAKLVASGGGIKFLAENTDWNTPTQVIYGDVNGAGNTGTLTTSGGGNNVAVPSDGIYRITVDLANSKYYLQTGAIGAVGLVGAFQGWSPGTAIKMANLAPNKFIFITSMSQNDEFKFHDGNEWDNGALNKSRWFDDKGSNTLIINGAGAGTNLKWTGTTGNVRAIFNYTDVKNPSFSLTEGNGLWLIGSATLGGWDNAGTESDAQRPPLTYQGNGIWSGTVTLGAGEIKFIVKKGSWDFSYGGSGGVLSYQGGANIAVSAGVYTVTVNEYTGTYTIL